MPLDLEQGRRMLQLVTSRYNDWRWRKKIEKTLSLPPAGVDNPIQRAIFLYLKHGLKAYKSRRADPDAWVVGGWPTQEVIERAKHNPSVVQPGVGKQEVAFLGADPGAEVDEAWWDQMLVQWFEQPEDEAAEEATNTTEGTTVEEDPSAPGSRPA